MLKSTLTLATAVLAVSVSGALAGDGGCNWMKSHVTAQSTPPATATEPTRTTEQTPIPATSGENVTQTAQTTAPAETAPPVKTN
jgi:hypothetical protein